jgi:hypothetical protein
LSEDDYPDYLWFIRHTIIDDTWSVLVEEKSILQGSETRSLILQKLEGQDVEKAALTDFEKVGSNFWMTIHSVATEIMLGQSAKKEALPKRVQHIHDWLTNVLQPELKTHFEQSSQEDGKDVTDASIVPTSKTLQTVFYTLELLRTTTKLCDVILAIHKQKAAHKLKEVLKKDKIVQVAATVEEIYKSIGAYLNERLREASHIGERSLKAQVQFGQTGAALQDLGSSQGVASYLEATRDAYKSALKVSLRGPASK